MSPQGLAPAGINDWKEAMMSAITLGRETDQASQNLGDDSQAQKDHDEIVERYCWD